MMPRIGVVRKKATALWPYHHWTRPSCSRRRSDRNVDERGRQRKVVDDVEHRHGDDGGDVEPERDVEAGLVAFGQRPEEVDGEDHPDQDHGDVDGPDQLGVFLAAGEAGGQGDGGGHDDELPAPEVDFREQVRGGAAPCRALGRVIDPANIMLPTKAKITALVCSGRRRPKVIDLVVAGLSVTCSVGVEQLPHAGRAHRVAGADEAAARVDRQLAVESMPPSSTAFQLSPGLVSPKWSIAMYSRW
jgi:hypothetical protein